MSKIIKFSKKDILNFLKNSIFEEDIIEEKDGSFSFERNLDLISLNLDIKELPFKINKVYGDFYINDYGLESFKNFPNYVNGNLHAQNNNFTSWDGWEVKEVGGNINLCGPDCELPDLDELYHTKFNKIFLKIGNTIFKDDIIPKKYEKFSKLMFFEEFEKIKEDGLIKDISVDCDNYLENLFNFQISLNQNK